VRPLPALILFSFKLDSKNSIDPFHSWQTMILLLSTREKSLMQTVILITQTKTIDLTEHSPLRSVRLLVDEVVGFNHIRVNSSPAPQGGERDM